MRSPARLRHARSGVTLLEAVIALAVMTVAVGLFSSMVVSASRQRVVNHEYPVASSAVRVLLEEMRNHDFAEVFALYNADPDDDPGGADTAPGNRFAVEGLEPLDGVEDGTVGEVFFPTVVTADGDLQLREDVQDETLGMPRDLDGDSIVNEEDQAKDYVLLPIRVEVDWQGRYGERHVEFHTMLAEFRK